MKDQSSMKDYLISGIKLAVAGVTILSTFYTLVDLTLFLSNNKLQKGLLKDGKEEQLWTWTLFIDMALIAIFIFLHSLLALPSIKSMWMKYNIQEMQRSFYILVTCVTLQVLLKNWIQTSDIILWNFSDNSSLNWMFFVFHISSWTFIYVASICMDINEMLGIKQIYYNVKSLPDPLSCKSLELKRLYTHMRHPSFVGFMIIFWAVPIMSLDRWLLASILSLYMYLTWNTDNMDCRYLQLQYAKKFNSHVY